MIKRVWASFGPLSYRAREHYLDEMARKGWQLQKEGSWGMRFVETEPRERYHRTAARPPEGLGVFLREGEEILCEVGKQTVVAGHTPKTLAEELAQDKAMQPLARKILREAPIQLIGIGLLMLSMYWAVTDGWDDGLFDLIFAYPLGVVMTAVILTFMLVSVAAELLACLRLHWAKVDERPYEPLLQTIFWYGLQKTLIVLYMGIVIVGGIWLISHGAP